MARIIPVFAGGGFLLGALGAVGWHFQPVLPGLGAPRPVYQVLQALSGKIDTTGPLYSGVVASDALSWWHQPSWVPILALPVLGVLLGTVLGAVVRSHEARTQPHPASTGRASRSSGAVLIGAGALGLILGVATALSWHVEPEALLGGPWSGIWFWPVDVLYPALGLFLALGTAATLTRTRRGPEEHHADNPTT